MCQNSRFQSDEAAESQIDVLSPDHNGLHLWRYHRVFHTVPNNHHIQSHSEVITADTIPCPNLT